MVRLATAGDAAELARLLHAFNTEFDSPTPEVPALTRRCRQLLEEGELIALLAEDPPVGLAVVRLRPLLWTESDDALEAYLEELYVAPERRGGGLGRALLDMAMEIARERGAVRMDLGTSTDDTAARGLYESAGFTNREGGDDGPTMLMYERDLVQPSE